MLSPFYLVGPCCGWDFLVSLAVVVAVAAVVAAVVWDDQRRPSNF
jgi:hypothetical protein